MTQQWQLIRNALSENPPIILPDEKISENSSYNVYDLHGTLIHDTTTRKIKEILKKYLIGNELTFSKDMTEQETNNGIVLWASASDADKKRKSTENVYQLCITTVLTVFTRADQTIKAIHQANGY